MAQKGLWNRAREKILWERGALPKEESDAMREYQAMNEENLLRRWEGEMVKVSNENQKERSEKRRGGGEKEENEPETFFFKKKNMRFLFLL